MRKDGKNHVFSFLLYWFFEGLTFDKLTLLISLRSTTHYLQKEGYLPSANFLPVLQLITEKN